MGFFKTVQEEIKIIKDRDPALHSDWEVLLYPSFRAILSYRRAHKQYLKGHFFRARWISQRAARKTGIEIHPGATIGKGLFIDHGTGVVIGETTIIGDNVTLYQGVTLGGTGKEQGKRHLGSFKVGDNCKIAAGSVVLQEIPPNCTVVGVPARVVKMIRPGQGDNDLDQIHFPDPVQIDIECLNRGQSALTNQLLDIQDSIRESRALVRRALNEKEELEKKLSEAEKELLEERRLLEIQRKRSDDLEKLVRMEFGDEKARQTMRKTRQENANISLTDSAL